MNRRQFMRGLAVASAAAWFAEPLEHLGRVYSFPSKIVITERQLWDIRTRFESFDSMVGLGFFDTDSPGGTFMGIDRSRPYDYRNSELTLEKLRDMFPEPKAKIFNLAVPKGV